MAVDSLLAMLCVSTMIITCNMVVESEINFKRSVEEKWKEITDRENEILSSIEAGCALGCLGEMDLR